MSCEGTLILFCEVHWKNIFVGISWEGEKRNDLLWFGLAKLEMS